MKNNLWYLVFAILLLSTQTLLGQEMEEDEEDEKGKIPISYIRLPLTPLPDEYKTYALDFIIDKSRLYRSYTEGELSRHINLHGFEKTMGKANLVVLFEINGLNIEREDIESYTKTEKKKGVERTVTKYQYEVEYTLPISMKVMDASGRVLLTEVLRRANQKSRISTLHHNSEDELRAYWRKNRHNKIGDNENSDILGALSRANGILLSQYCHTPITKKVKISVPDKKNCDYENYKNAHQHTQKGFQLLSGQKYEEAKPIMEQAIDLWKTELKRAEAEKKCFKKKTIYYTYLNISNAYLWQNDLQKANEYLQEATKHKTGIKSNQTRRLIEDQHKRFKANGFVP